MFHVDLPESENKNSVNKPPLKKKKLDELYHLKSVHSSLSYCSLRAPPLVEYKFVDSYRESKLGKSLVPSLNKSSDSPSNSVLNNLQNISSPIIFKTPKLLSDKRTLPSNGSKSYAFYSIEELSLVNCILHWKNTKVCAIGHIFYESNKQQCYLQSIMEKGQWQLLLDTSLLPEIPNLQGLFQIFGAVEVTDRIPRLKIDFYRNLGSVDLPLFVESYKLMQKYVPEFVDQPGNEEAADLTIQVDNEVRSETELNDPLD